MKRKVIVVLLAGALAAFAIGAPATANPGGEGSSGVTDPLVLALITDDTVFALADLTTLLSAGGQYRTQHYGPFPSTSPDSGTCGNDWATDEFDRHFTVRSNHDGTFTVVQQFKRGSFVVNPPQQLSPGSCDPTDGRPPGTVNGGVEGTMQGYFIISNVVNQTSTDEHCDAVTMTNADCTTTTFINTHFTPCYPATCQVTTYALNYAAPDQGLIDHHWKNASTDRGGNQGDIRSSGL